MADGKSDPGDAQPRRGTPGNRRQSQLPPEAIELGRRIAESAPPVSEAKLARLRLLLHGTGVVAPDDGRDNSELPRAMREYADETVAKAPPVHSGRGDSGAPAQVRRDRAGAGLPLSDPGYTAVGPEALDLLTVEEVAARLRCSPRTVRRLIYADRKAPGTGLESVRLGSLVRIPPEAVAAYIARLRQDGAR